jgi:hypothetical protein
MNPGNLNFDYFGGIFFAAYEFASEDGLSPECKIRIMRWYLLDSVGHLDSGLL